MSNLKSIILSLILFALTFSLPFNLLHAEATDETEWREMNRRVINLFAQGQKEEGIEMMKEVIITAEQQFGEVSEVVAKSINNLGNFYFHMNKIEDARKQYFRAIEIEKQLENAEALIAGSYFNLAMTYATDKSAPEIRQYLDEALFYYRKNETQYKEAIERIENLKDKLGIQSK